MFQGKLFCGVLPSGNILSYETGRCISHDDELPSGWVHIAAQRKGSTMVLFINGKRVNEKSDANLDINNNAPLRIGVGQHDHFNGRMKDLRWYTRALDDVEIAALSGS